MGRTQQEKSASSITFLAFFWSCITSSNPILHFRIRLERLSWKILCVLLGTLLEQLHLVRVSTGITSMIMRRCPGLIIGTHLFFMYMYPTLHACCVADTNLHTSLSTCSTSATDGRSPRFHCVASIWNFLDSGVVVARTSACFRNRQILLQDCEECLNETRARSTPPEWVKNSPIKECLFDAISGISLLSSFFTILCIDAVKTF